jgi:hypothetical protein
VVKAKLVVTNVAGGSQVSLVSASGKVLLTSETFSEPRAKGATVRALKGLLGEVTVEDETRKRPGAKPAVGSSSRSNRGADQTEPPANGTSATPGRRTRKAPAAA